MASGTVIDHTTETLFGSLAEVVRGGYIERGGFVHGVAESRSSSLALAAHLLRLAHIDIITPLVHSGAGLEEAARRDEPGGHILEVSLGDRNVLCTHEGIASYGGRLVTCRVLLELGADPSNADIDGCTPLMITCRRINVEEYAWLRRNIWY